MDPNQYIWDNFHSLSQGNPKSDFARVTGKSSQLSGPSREEFLQLLRHYGINTNNLAEVQRAAQEILEIQRKAAAHRTPFSNDEWSAKANSLENYINYIFKGMDFPRGGATSLPHHKK